MLLYSQFSYRLVSYGITPLTFALPNSPNHKILAQIFMAVLQNIQQIIVTISLDMLFVYKQTSNIEY